jgi:hypothetical protein
VPLQVLDSRLITKGNSQVMQVKVHWSGMLEDLVTWEEPEPLKHQFPSSPAWAEAGVQGGENVITKARGESKTASGPATPAGTRRSKRPRRANVRLSDL